MMKKRILALLLTVCMLLSLMPLGAFAEENSEDIQVLAEGSNEDEGGSGNQDPCAGGHSYVWTSNGNGTHTQVCSVCKTTGNTADCVKAGDATCTAAAVCKDCGAVMEEATGHSWGQWRPNDGTDTHTRTCSKCSATETKDCHGGTATCDTKALCEDCGASYGEVKHSDTVNYQYAGEDSNQHKILCSACGKVIGTESCTFTEANCQAASSCIKCHHTVGEKNPSKHVGGTKAVHNENTETHNVICKGCNTILEKDVPCTSDNSANCKHKSKCTACGGEVGALGNHKEGTPATCTTKAVCSVCGQAYGDPLGHDLKGGVCTRIATGKCVCSRDHKGLWKDADASQGTIQCPECGATIEKESLAVSFTLTGYGVGKASKNVRVTSGSDKVTVRSVTISPDDATFKAGTSYSFAIAYTVENGYRVDSATVNGTRAELGDTFVSVSLFSPDSYYSITYDLAGGKLPAGKTNPTTYTKESRDIILVNPEKEGWDFAGWKGTGLDQAAMTVTVPAGSTGNRGYTATWTAKSYTVTFDVQGHGTAPKAQTVQYGKKAATPKDPTESGYAFGGWYQDAACKQKFKFSTKITGDITLYAKWDEAYTLKFHTNGGNTINSINAAKGSTVELKKYKPSRSGYYFVGWYRTKDLKSGTQVSWQHMTDTYADSDGVIHVYAKWKKMDTTNPKTGDSSFPELAAGLLALSALSLGAVTLIGKKKRNW